MEEILASIRRIISEDDAPAEAAPVAAAPQPAPPPAPEPAWVSGPEAQFRAEAHATVMVGASVICVWCGRWGRRDAAWPAGQRTVWSHALPPRVVGMLAGPAGFVLAGDGPPGPRAWAASLARGFVCFRDAG